MSHICVFDLEASCWEFPNPLLRQEIIEIGAFLVNSYGELESQFNELVRPTEISGISSYCAQLTGITQDELETADSFPEVYDRWREWMNADLDSITCLSWGSKDWQLLIGECEYHSLNLKGIRYYDLKSQYHQIRVNKRKVGLNRALKNEGYSFEGHMHRALDDSYNLTKLFVHLREFWDMEA